MRRLLATFALAALASGAAAQDAAPRLPAALCMPWRTVGIDADQVAKARTALEQSAAALCQAAVDGGQTLTALAAARAPVTSNARKIADRIVVGAPRGAQGLVPLAFEATWTSIMDHELLVVTVADADRNALLGGAHVTMPRVEWEALARTGGLAARLTATVTRLHGEALAKARQNPRAPAGAKAADALHVGLALGREVTRRDEGSSHAMGLLLEEALAPRYTVARALGADRLATARDLLGVESRLRRPTRTAVLRWHHEPERAPPRRFPVALRLVATYAETVLGQPLAPRHESRWELTRTADGRVAAEPAPELLAFLEQERQALSLADMPRVVKVDRAWAYLDRGRAWGLKIGDRLVAEVDGEPVKGHVVRYFGPEQRLTSPRGFPVQEGAILFIRKGQRRTRPGLEFRFDPRAYPTPWPIPPGTP